MKIKFLIAILLILTSVGFVYSESYMPHDGVFAYKEVENHTLNGFNFTILSEYKLVYQNTTHMFFEGNNNTLNISVEDNNKTTDDYSTENMTASETTMMGSVEGNFADRNGTYTFSFEDNGKLITVSSKDMTLMMGVIGKD